MSITSSIPLVQESRLRAAYDGWVADIRRKRALRAKHAQLVAELSTYRSESDRADMDAMLGRYPESELHQVWNGVRAAATVPGYLHR